MQLPGSGDLFRSRAAAIQDFVGQGFAAVKVWPRISQGLCQQWSFAHLVQQSPSQISLRTFLKHHPAISHGLVSPP